VLRFIKVYFNVVTTFNLSILKNIPYSDRLKHFCSNWYDCCI